MTRIDYFFTPQYSADRTELADVASRFFSQFDCGTGEFEYDFQRKIKLTDAPNFVEPRETLIGFSLHGGRLKVSLVSAGQFDFDLFNTSFEEQIGLDQLEELVSPITLMPGFLFAAAIDEDYFQWQNETNPGRFSNEAELELVSNGLPGSLEEKIVDISRNPGRRIHRRSFSEMIGGVMWLAPNFFQVTKCQRDEFLADFEPILSESSGILKVILDDSLLAEAQDNSELSRSIEELRSALFPSAGVEVL